MRSDMIHARIQDGVGPRSVWHIKKALTLLFFIFFSPQLILQKSSVFFQENYYLPRFHWERNIFERGGGGGGGGGPTFYRGPIALSL